MSSLLFGVEPLDLPTYAAVLGVLGMAAALASYAAGAQGSGCRSVRDVNGRVNPA